MVVLEIDEDDILVEVGPVVVDGVCVVDGVTATQT